MFLSPSSTLVDISLSPKTAHAFLSVSDDRKQVRHTDKHQEVPDNPKRFDRVANVLGRESFSSGRYCNVPLYTVCLYNIILYLHIYIIIKIYDHISMVLRTAVRPSDIVCLLNFTETIHS